MTLSPISKLNYRTVPLTNTTPLTYRDGATFQTLLNLILKYLSETYPNSVDQALNELKEWTEGQITDLGNFIIETEARHLELIEKTIIRFQEIVDSINERNGPVPIQTVELTNTSEMVISDTWPRTYPVWFKLVQNGSGSGSLRLPTNIVNPDHLVVSTTPNISALILIYPVGEDQWAIDSDNYVEYKLDKFATEVMEAGDPLAYINNVRAIVKVPARPVGTLFPQAFSTDPNLDRLYVAYSGTTVADSGPMLRIAIHKLSTGEYVEHKEISTEESTSSEGLPWFRNSLGQLIFVIRPFTIGSGYALFNYDTGTSGGRIEIPGGNYKSAVCGDKFYTCNSNSAAGGVDRVFVWSWPSIQAGTPELLETVRLQSNNLMEKVQSFTVNAGVMIFNHGESKGQIKLSTYTQTGTLISAVSYDRVDFALAVNAGFPMTITNVNDFRHEGEGADVLDGKALTGHVVDNNSNDYQLIILSHNEVTGIRLGTNPEVMITDTGWLDCTLSPGVVKFGDGTEPRARRAGNVIFVDGAIKGVPANPNDFVAFTLPSGLVPVRQLEPPLMKTTNKNVAGWKIRPGGQVLIHYTTFETSDTESWYPFQFSFLFR